MVRPPQNLPPGSQQWARSVETDVETLMRNARDGDQRLDNTLRGLSTSLANLGTLVQTIADQQQQLAQQQATLTQQQATLTQQVNQINQLVNSQIITSDFTATGSGFGAAANSWTTTATSTVAVPQGYSQALVFANAWWYASNNTITVTSLLNGRAVVNGLTSPTATNQIDANQVAQGDIANTRRLTGLAGGSTFNISVQVYANAGIVGDGNNNSRIYGSILWLR